ncbi:MAG: HAD hydrolase-like protein [Opitutales bacterium]|nr:HAD hydrolase-like protein [Opitutales bacterium]
MSKSEDILLLWDIDGTLLSAKGAGPKAFDWATIDHFGYEIPVASIDWLGATDYSIAYAMLEKAGKTATRQEAQELIDCYLSYLPEMLDATNARAIEGTQELLEHFHRHDAVHQALLTGNVRRGADIKLGYIGVDHYFRFGAFADHSDQRNDLSRHALDLAREHLHPEWSPERIYVIGDTPKDIECGKFIGAHTIAVATGHHSVEQLQEHDPSALFKTFSDPSVLIDYLGL